MPGREYMFKRILEDPAFDTIINQKEVTMYSATIQINKIVLNTQRTAVSLASTKDQQQPTSQTFSA